MTSDIDYDRHLKYKDWFDLERFLYHNSSKNDDKMDNFIDILDSKTGDFLSTLGLIDRYYYNRDGNVFNRYNPNDPNAIAFTNIANALNIDYGLYITEIVEYTGYEKAV